jgi:D-glycero-beta-D-manno-heptose-7-phosphate kinase
MTGDQLARIVTASRGRKVLVIGDVMLDEYLWGDVRRISPEAPVPVVDLRQRSYRAGGAANVAANITSLGGVALLGGIVGNDAASHALRETLAELEVDAGGLLVDEKRQTTVKTRVIAHSQHVVRIDAEERRAVDPSLVEKLLCWATERMAQVDACVLSDYAKGLITSGLAETYMSEARGRGKPVVVDPKGAQFQKYRGATVSKPNIQEAMEMLHRPIHDEADLVTAGRQLVDLLGGTAHLLTRGPQGMSLFQAEQEPYHIPAVARNVYDVTGAGDTVVSALALGLAGGASLEDSAWMANHAAGVVVGKVGTTTVSVDELLSR